MQIRASLLVGIVLAVLIISFVGGFEASTRSTTIVQPTTVVKITTETSYFSSGNATTLTEYIVSEGYAYAKYIVSGTCTIAIPTIAVNFTTTTTYIQPANISSHFNASITTVNSYTVVGTKSFTTTVSTSSNGTSSTTSGCPTYG